MAGSNVTSVTAALRGLHDEVNQTETADDDVTDLLQTTPHQLDLQQVTLQPSSFDMNTTHATAADPSTSFMPRWITTNAPPDP